jgi:hypothetical protein
MRRNVVSRTDGTRFKCSSDGLFFVITLRGGDPLQEAKGIRIDIRT